jgi:ferredoxin
MSRNRSIVSRQEIVGETRRRRESAVTLYYFSGSGNSLAIARRLSEALGTAHVVSIPRAIQEGIDAPSGVVGFVFPTYAYGLPRMVAEFVHQLDLPTERYLFAVASSFGIPGGVLLQFDRLLRKKGRRLDAGFAVLDERSSLTQDPDNDAVQRLMIWLNRGDSPERSSVRTEEIAGMVAAGQRHPPESSNRVTNLVGGVLNSLAGRSFPQMASNFRSDERCIGCGTCARVCPRANIQLESGKPVWRSDCEMCHACIQWCPNEAIQFGDLTVDRPRYRNPEVALQDMVLR